MDEHAVPEGFAFIKIYWISLDPLLKTWISGARSYLDPVTPGSGVPGFGIARALKITRDRKKETNIE
jgi:NADPH-dependent curcumin reductase CurA